MPDPRLVELLYARRTLAEMTSKWREQTDLPADSDLGKMVQAQVLLEQGKQEEAQEILMGVIVDAEETRVKLWAAKSLRDLGLWPGGPMAQEAQGVVFEVPMEGSQDVLAAYRDTCVRFFRTAARWLSMSPLLTFRPLRNYASNSSALPTRSLKIQNQRRTAQETLTSLSSPPGARSCRP